MTEEQIELTGLIAQTVIATVAVVALLLSAYNTWILRRDMLPRLKLRNELQIIAGNVDQYVAKFSAGNPGDRTVHVVSARLEFPERLRNRLKVRNHRPKRKLYLKDHFNKPVDVGLPTPIESGQPLTMYTGFTGIVSMLRELGYKDAGPVILVVEDGMANQHKIKIKVQWENK